MDLIQDSNSINQDIELAQQQLNDIIAQQSSRRFEGLEEDYDRLGELEIAESMKDFGKESRVSVKEHDKTIQKQEKARSNYNKLLNDLLN